MEGFFQKIGIYAHEGQKYEPVDSEQLSSYREDKTGQVLEEGITESGAMSSWIAELSRQQIEMRSRARRIPSPRGARDAPIAHSRWLMGATDAFADASLLKDTEFEPAL